MQSIIDAFKFIGDNLHFLLTKTLEHLALSGAAIAVSLVIAIPLGVTLGHLHKGSFLAINASNIGRALPSLAIISIGIGILGIGFINVMVAMVVLAVPPMLTNAYVAVDGVDRDAVEAARAVGMSPRQVLWKVEMPLERSTWWRPLPSPPSPAAAAWATSSSTRRATGPRASSQGR
jgi:osmoprotectant transport system permease protein